MTMLDRIKADQLEARKSRDSIVANLLGTVIAACDTKAKQGKAACVLTDAEVLDVIKSTRKRVTETVDLLNGNTDRAEELAKYQREAEKLASYLPQQLSKDELTEIAMRQNSLGLNMGQIMAHLKSSYAGRYDAKEASEIVRGIL